MNVLIACEESQEVCMAFRVAGHKAFSCDLQEPSGGHPEWHIRGDVKDVLNFDRRSSILFETMDGEAHNIAGGYWDLLIAHPPCTYLTAASAVRLFNKDHSIKDAARQEKGYNAALFFNAILRRSAAYRIAVENPVPLKCYDLPPYDQIIEPFMFGDPWKKRTCLWLQGLPKLRPTDIVEPLGLWVGSTSARRDPGVRDRYVLHSNRDPKRRSKTFPGIAKAMAEQWGGGETI